MKNRSIFIAVLAICALALLSGCVKRGEDGSSVGTASPSVITTETPTASPCVPSPGDTPASAPDGTAAAEETAGTDDEGGAGGDSGGEDAGGTEMEETDDILEDILRQLDELEDIYSDVEEDDVSDADLADS